MTIVQAKTNPYGPPTIDVQMEQGATFSLPFEAKRSGDPWDLTTATVEAWFAPQGATTPLQVPLTITPVDLSAGTFSVDFPAADSAALVSFQLGKWVLHITAGSVTVRMAEGTVYLDTLPWLT